MESSRNEHEEKDDVDERRSESGVVVTSASPDGDAIFIEEVVSFSLGRVSEDVGDHTETGKSFLNVLNARVLVRAERMIKG